MRKRLYQIYDTTAGEVIGPIAAFPRDEAAKRWFVEVINNKQEGNQVANYPKEHVLLYLGDQETDSGNIDTKIASSIYGGDTYLAELELERQRLAARPPAPAPAANGAADASAGGAILGEYGGIESPPGLDNEAAAEKHRRTMALRQSLTDDAMEEEFQKRLLEIRARRAAKDPE